MSQAWCTGGKISVTFKAVLESSLFYKRRGEMMAWNARARTLYDVGFYLILCISRTYWSLRTDSKIGEGRFSRKDFQARLLQKTLRQFCCRTLRKYKEMIQIIHHKKRAKMGFALTSFIHNWRCAGNTSCLMMVEYGQLVWNRKGIEVMYSDAGTSSAALQCMHA